MTDFDGRHAPLEGCICTVCNWANRRIEREWRFAKDLADNYQKFLDGDLVSKDDSE